MGEIRLGTCSWAHEFWKGQVYLQDYKSEKDFKLNSLREYVLFEPFSIVEIDSTFYTPPKEETLTQYMKLVPDNFLFTAKIWERISIPTYPDIKRYGKYAGLENPSFLDADLLIEKFLEPFEKSLFKKKLASLLLQFPRIDGISKRHKFFMERLEQFLDKFPKDYKLTIEIRNPELFRQDYFDLLNKHSVNHCFNCWHTMPTLLQQMKAIAAAGGLKSDFFLARLITPPNMKFDDAGKFFTPFNQIKLRHEDVRKDIIRLVKRAKELGKTVYILVNNRFEGNSPLTIREMADLITS